MGFIPDTFNNWQAVTGGTGGTGGAGGTGGVVKTRATTPAGSFNAQNRVYTVDTGSYPTSRLLVSTQYGPFVQATSSTYQVPSSYRAPEYWRFKIAASDTETESALLLSPAFAAVGTGLIDLPVGLMGIMQSNGTGFAPQSDVQASERGPFPLGLINAFGRNKLEPYQMGVNEEGIPASGSPVGVAGFGAEYQYLRRVQLAKDGTELIIKKNISARTGTPDGAGFNKWNTVLYAEYKQEIEQAFALCAAQGYRPVVKWMLLDVKEAEQDNPNFVSGYQALIQRFQDDGLITADTKLLIPLGYRAADVNGTTGLRAKQDALYQTDPTRFFKIDLGQQPTIDGTHLNSIGQINMGNAIYNYVHATTTPPATGNGGSGNVGTYPLKSGYDNNTKLIVVASGAATSYANGFTMFSKVTPKFIGSQYTPESYIYSGGDLASSGSDDESVSVSLLDSGQVRVRVKTSLKVDTSAILKAQDGSPVVLVPNATYRFITIVSEANGQVLVKVYINGVEYSFTYGGTLNKPTSPVTFGSILVGKSATAYPYALIGDQEQLGFINRAYSASEVASLDVAGLVLTKTQYEMAEVAVYAPGPTETATSTTTANLADTNHNLLVTRL